MPLWNVATEEEVEKCSVCKGEGIIKRNNGKYSPCPACNQPRPTFNSTPYNPFNESSFSSSGFTTTLGDDELST